jgi:tRNA (adenine22-N1)-methyltransferase
MILSERLSRIASYVPGELVVADIGTDHALLPIYLVLQEIASHVIACDISSGPLESARANIYLYKLTEKIEIRQGDGLEPLNRGEADVIIISGMGGAKIRDILETSPDVLDGVVRIILQPQRGAGIVRRWLFDHDWEITDEDLVLENDNYYEIIIAEHTMNVGVFAIDKNLGRQEEELLDVGPRLVEKKHPLNHPARLQGTLSHTQKDLFAELAHFIPQTTGTTRPENNPLRYQKIKKHLPHHL